jgi:starch-binding outer membrane protein, SusD/RagB family
MRNYIHLLLIIIGLSLSACEKFLEPLIDNDKLTEEQLLKDPAYLEGLLITAYNGLPSNLNFGIDVATNDAASNMQNYNYTEMATGSWSSNFNPLNEWAGSYAQIFAVNSFIERFQLIKWSFSPNLTTEENMLRNLGHIKRLKGEAYGLRAWYEFQLLQYHSGISSDGTLLGFPIVTKTLTTDDDLELDRNTFSECVQQIMSDLDTAILNLPPVYLDIPGDNIAIATSGAKFENRINGNAARALKSRLAVLASSEAFSASGVVSWDEAAAISGDFLNDLGPLPATGLLFYQSTNNDEVIWNLAVRQMRTWEVNNFPPSLFGNGSTNPSQSLVDAFPMENGYPISDLANSGYDALNPYNGRDPRLSEYILYNGSTFKSTQILTHVDAPLDGLNVLEHSTRTGYYLKKFMSESVNLNPNNLSNSPHNYTLFRVTEVLLNFAEAANEAWGPDGTDSHGASARSKIAELRIRAGISQPDVYLASISTKEEMRELIRNERRIELCFEGFRFWDIRRWGETELMKQAVTGVSITADGEGIPTAFSPFIVENRDYHDYMIYGPIPFNETLKYNIIQNAGW